MMTKPDFIKKQILFVTLYQDEKISFNNDNIIVKTKDGEVKYQVTCYRIFALYVIGHMTLTTGIIQRSHKFGFPIVLMTSSLKVYDVIGAKMEGNVLLRKYQYIYKGIDIGQHIIKNKILNQKHVLNNIRIKTPELKDAIRNIEKYLQILSQNQLSVEQIMGYEGMAAKLYFKHIFNQEEWKGRKPRIKSDYINATLDIGYTILFNLVDAMLTIYGFDCYQGVFHKQFYMRKSLVCDLMEPFRPLIDWQVRRAINLKMCSVDDFDVINHRYMLKWKENPKYIKFIIEVLMDSKGDIFEYIQMYYRAFMKQKEASEYPVFKIV